MKFKQFFKKIGTGLKTFFVKTGNWFKNHHPSKRRIIQLYAALLYNANIKGFISGDIFTGSTKNTCVPGLNCYSCPGAVGACPLGSLQNALAGANKTVPYYILGILALYGLIFGRTICGFLCPVGLAQELLYKIKTPKVKKNRITYVFTYLKVVIFAIFIVALPIAFGLLGYTNPGFCKYFCPAGTFGGGYMLLLNPNNEGFFAMLGNLFSWKSLLLVIIVILSIFFYRFFCRFMCPLGLIYGIFNKFSFIGVQVVKDKCTNCGLCVNACKMDIRKVGDHECINCGECINVCPEQAIIWKGSKFFLHKNQLEPVESNIKIDLTSNLPQVTPEKIAEISAEPQQKSENTATEVKVSKKEKAPLYDKKKTKIFFISLFSALTVITATALIYFNFIHKEPVRGDFAIGVQSPTFTVEMYNSDEQYTMKLNDKPKVINFWATWCGPCVQELPHFEDLYREYNGDVEFVALHNGEEIEDVDAFILKQFPGFTLTFANDIDLIENRSMYTYYGGPGALPYTVVLDRRNVCTFIKTGSITKDELKEQVEIALKQ